MKTLRGLIPLKEWISKNKGKNISEGKKEALKRKEANKKRYQRAKEIWLKENPDKKPEQFSSERAWGSIYRRYSHVRNQRKAEYRLNLATYAYVRWGITEPSKHKDNLEQYQVLMNLISLGYNPETTKFDSEYEMIEIKTPNKKGRNVHMQPAKGRWDITFEEWLAIGGKLASSSPNLSLIRKDANGPFSKDNMKISIK